VHATGNAPMGQEVGPVAQEYVLIPPPNPRPETQHT
jgi:hypothetical protein